jgi:hypothetical protein
MLGRHKLWGTTGHPLMTCGSAQEEPQGRLDLHRALIGWAGSDRRTSGMVET